MESGLMGGHFSSNEIK